MRDTERDRKREGEKRKTDRRRRVREIETRVREQKVGLSLPEQFREFQDQLPVKLQSA